MSDHDRKATQGAEYTDHTGSVVAWREAGEGPPVVFLHGLGGTRSAWGPQLRELSNRFRCIAWDMPGYGDSQPIEPLTFETTADRLVALLDTLDIEQADLVGLSFGGMHALHTAVHHPERVGRMVLADTSPAFGLDGTTREEWTASRLAAINAGQSPADIAEAVVDAITATRLTGQVREETVGAFGAIPVEGFRAAVGCLPDHDIRSALATIEHECLVIVGELDEETPVTYARALADGLPHAVLHILDGIGHLSPAEAPDRFNTLVADFLTRRP